MSNTQTDNMAGDEINRTQAALLLGVSVTSVKSYPIPFRQYKPKSKAMYRKSDVMAFKQASTRSNESAA